MLRMFGRKSSARICWILEQERDCFPYFLQCFLDLAPEQLMSSSSIQQCNNRNIISFGAFHVFFCLLFFKLLILLIAMFRIDRTIHKQREVLKDLDILTGQTNINQAAPSVERGQQQMKHFDVLDAQGNKLSVFCSLDEFKKFGPGVYLIFAFMKFITLVWAVLSPFALASVLMLVGVGEYQIDRSNFQTAFESTTISHTNTSIHRFIMAFNFAISLGLSIALVIWTIKQKDMVLQCAKQVNLPSYFTLILTKIPNYYQQNELLRTIEEECGIIKGIYTVKDFGEDLETFKEITKTLQGIKEEKEILSRYSTKRSCKKLIERFLEFRKQHSNAQISTLQSPSYLPTFAFITFSSVLQKQMVLNSYSSPLCSCSNDTTHRKQIQYKGQLLEFDVCEMEPDGIVWQNLNVTKKQKCCRIIGVVFILGTFLFASCWVIFLLSAIESGLYISGYASLTAQQILALNTTQAIQSYCLHLSFHKFQSESICSPFLHEYISYTILFVFFPILITFLKFVFAECMKYMVRFRRHQYEIQKIESQILIVAIFYFIKAGLIKFFMYRKFELWGAHFGLLSVFLPLLHQLHAFLPIHPQHIETYQDFSREWVNHTSHAVILIALISFTLSILIGLFTTAIRSCILRKRAKNQLTQKAINKCLQGCQLEIEFIYAQMLAIMLFSLLYTPCMPIVYLFALASLIILYWVTKFIFVRYCAKPPVYSHSISTMAVKIAFAAIMVNCVVAPWYLASIYFDFEEGESMTFWERQAQMPYYPILFVFIALYLFFGKFIFRLYLALKNCIGKLRDNGFQTRHYRTKLTFMESKATIQSYSMYQNQHYTDILKSLYIINKVEQHHAKGHFRAKLLQIHQSAREMNMISKSGHILFDQMMSQLQLEEKIAKSVFEKRGKSSFFKSPLDKLMEVMSEIKQKVKQEEESDTKFMEMNKSIHSKIKQHIQKSLVVQQRYTTEQQLDPAANKPISQLNEIGGLPTEDRFMNNPKSP